MFEWPDTGREEYAPQEAFCYALRNQVGVLVDGTVVPCCLDHDGDIALGNLFHVKRIIFGYHSPESQIHAIDVLKGTAEPKGTLPFEIQLQ